jgi:Fungalysin/Thermolysin Propeptide Motif
MASDKRLAAGARFAGARGRTMRAPFLLLVLAACVAAPDADGITIRRVERSPDGVIRLLDGKLGGVASPITDVASAELALGPVIEDIAARFDLRASKLIVTGVEHDPFGWTHVRLAQQMDSLRVVGGDIVVHLERDAIRSINGTAREAAVRAPATLTSARAVELATTSMGAVDVQRIELVHVITTGRDELRLAWEVTVSGRDLLLEDRVYVDARTGDIVERLPRVYTARSRTIYDGGGGTCPFTTCGAASRA